MRDLREWYRDGQESDEVRRRKAVQFQLEICEERNPPSDMLFSNGLALIGAPLLQLGFEGYGPEIPTENKPGDFDRWLGAPMPPYQQQADIYQPPPVEQTVDAESRSSAAYQRWQEDDGGASFLGTIGAAGSWSNLPEIETGNNPPLATQSQSNLGGGGGGGGGGGLDTTQYAGRSQDQTAHGENANLQIGVDPNIYSYSSDSSSTTATQTTTTTKMVVQTVETTSSDSSASQSATTTDTTANASTSSADSGGASVAIDDKLLSVVDGTGASSNSSGAGTPGIDQATAWDSYRNITASQPIRFEQNVGQTDASVDYTASGLNYRLWINSSEAVMSLSSSTAATNASSASTQVLRFQLVGSNASATAEGRDQLQAKTNYLIGNDRSQWHTDVANYGKVAYTNVWDGIDIVYYGTERKQLEFDLNVHAGADVSQAQFDIGGAQSLRIGESGNLVIGLTDGGEVVQHAPVLYQTIDGERVDVAGSFVLFGGNRVGFAVGDYDHSRDLVIDPVLQYGTYLGGSGSEGGSGDGAGSIHVDASGNIYVSGWNASSDFPTYNPIYTSGSAFVTKFTPTGTLAYSTYIAGSSGSAGGSGVYVDPAGNAYITGATTSSNYPTTAGAYQTSFSGIVWSHIFVTKINPAGNTLVYSTFVTGSDGMEQGSSIAVDRDGNATVVGNAGSSDFPTANAYQSSRQGMQDAVIVKLNASGSSLIYSSYLGGTATQSAYAVTVDSASEAVIVGQTYSSNFPTLNAYQSSLSGSNDIFVSRFSPSGTLKASTYFGGSGNDSGLGLAADAFDNVYLTGYTQSTDFPTVNPYQASNAGGKDAVVVKWSSTSATPVYSTYLGGSVDDTGRSIIVDSQGRAIVTGETNRDIVWNNNTFPQVGANQSFGGGDSDAFITRLTADGSTLQYSTYLGGSGRDVGTGVTVDSSDNIYVTGVTASSNFPTKNAYDSTLGGTQDAFVVKLGGPDVPAITSFATDTGSSGSDKLTNDQTLTFSGTSVASAAITMLYRRSGDGLYTTMGATTANGSGAWTYDYTATTLPEGVYEFVARVTVGGLDADSLPYRVTIDRTNPTINLTVDSPTYSTSPMAQVTVSDLRGIGTTVVLDIDLNNDGDYLDAGEANYASANLINGSAWFWVWPALSVGTCTFRARALDAAGNEGTSANKTVVIQSIGTPWTLTNLTPTTSDTASASEQLGYAGAVQLQQSVDLDQSPGTARSGNAALEYNSATVDPAPVVQAALQSNIGAGMPSQIMATLTWDGSTVVTQTYSSFSDVQPGQQWIVGLQAPSGQSTGRHTYTLNLFIDFTNDAYDSTATMSGSTFAVNRNSSVFGSGWNLNSLERLIDIPASGSYAAGKLRVYGNGDWAFYEGTSTFTSPHNDGGTLSTITGGFQYATPEQDKYTYNSNGYLTKWVSHDGKNTHTYSYDGSNNPTKIEYPDSSVATIAYASGMVSALVAANDRRTTLAYSGTDLTTITNAASETHTFAYNANHRVTGETVGLLHNSWTYANHMVSAIQNGDATAASLTPSLKRGLATPASNYAWSDYTDPLGNIAKTRYNADGRVLQTKDALGGVQTWTRNASGWITSNTDEIGRVTTYTVDAAGYVTATQKPDGALYTVTYESSFHQIETTKDPNGNVTSYAYNASGQLTKITDALNNVTTYTYTNAGDVETVLNALGYTTTSVYDGSRRRTALVQPEGDRTTFGYDANGELSTTKDALNNVTTSVYDAVGRLTKTIDALGGVATYIYDPSGLLKGTINELGQRTSYSYDARGLLTSTIQAVGTSEQRTLTATYDAASQQTSAVNAAGETYAATYNATGLQASITDPTGAVSQNVFDLAGQPTAGIDTFGNTPQTIYDPAGRVTTSTDVYGNRTTYVYDNAGNAIAVIDAKGNRTTTVYDALNRAIAVQDALGNRSTVVYDAIGRVEATIDALGHRTTTIYDGNNRPTAVVDALNKRATSVYDAVGNVINTFDQLNNKTTIVYDALHRATSTIDALGNCSTAVYDALGNLTSTIDANNNHTTYVYDNLNRRTAAIDAPNNRSTTVYDAADRVVATIDPLGNRTTFQYDAAGRLTGTIDAQWSTTATQYDAAGNVIAQTDKLGNTWRTTYDALGRAIRQVDPLGNVTTLVYDEVGNVTATIDPIGNRTTYLYDAVYHNTAVVDALNNRTTIAYDAAGNATAITNARNYTTTTSYDALNRPEVVTDALNGRTTTVYDAAGNVQAIVDPLGNRTTSVYDALNRVIASVDALGNRTTVSYDAVGNAVNTFDQLNNKTTIAYDAVGRVVNVTDPLGNTSTLVYDAAGNLINEIDPLGSKTTLIYDSLNRAVARLDPLGNRTTTVYDKTGRAVVQIDAKGNTTRSFYDAGGRLVQTADALFNRTSYVYDIAGNMTASIDQVGARTTLAYDALNRQITQTKPSGAVETTVYDAVGNIVNTIDGLGHKNTYVYDALNRQTQSIDALSGTTTSIYDAVGNRTGLIDPVGNRTTWVYDALNRVTSETSANNNTATFAYDAASRQTSTTDMLGRRRDFTYDANSNLLTEKWYAVGGSFLQTQTFTYDEVGNMLTAVDPDGIYTMTYDALNRTSVVQEPFSLTLTFSYDAASNRTVVQDSKGGLATSTYNALNELTRRQFTGNGATLTYDYTYTARGETQTLKRYSDLGTTVVFETDTTYDSSGRVTNIKHYNGSAANFSNTTYAYDAADRLTVETENGTSKTYAYDNTDQLTADGTTTVTYDANGNRNNGSYTVGTGNRITNDGTWTYSYDAAETRTKKSKGASQETWTYEYDLHNHLTRVEKRATDGGTLLLRIDYSYDALGNRIRRTVYDGSLNVLEDQKFGYDGWDTALASGGASARRVSPSGFAPDNSAFNVWADLNASDNSLNTRRLFGNSYDQTIARISSTGTVAYYANDRQNSVRYLLDASGTVQATLVYDGYGNITSNSNSGFTDRYTYTGRENELSAPHLQSNRGNTYALDISRWLAPDWWRDNAKNLTVYALNRPTNATDPSGNYIMINSHDDLRAWEQFLNSWGYGFSTHYMSNGRGMLWIHPDWENNFRGYLASFWGPDMVDRVMSANGSYATNVLFTGTPQNGFIADFSYRVSRYRLRGETEFREALRVQSSWNNDYYSQFAPKPDPTPATPQPTRLITVSQIIASMIYSGYQQSSEYGDPDQINAQRFAQEDGRPVTNTLTLGSGGTFFGQSYNEAGNSAARYTVQMMRSAASGLPYIGPVIAIDDLYNAYSSGQISAIDMMAAVQALRNANRLRINGRVYCFPAGTPVATTRGLKAIERIEAGEKVWAYDLVASKWRPCQVLETFRREYQGRSVFVTVEGETIEATFRHPFWVVRGEALAQRLRLSHLAPIPEETTTPGRWVDAGDLQVGDELLLRDGRIAAIEQIRISPFDGTVYNLAVEELHCYAVGENSVLVHNTNAPESGDVPSANGNGGRTVRQPRSAQQVFQELPPRQSLSDLSPYPIPGGARTSYAVRPGSASGGRSYSEFRYTWTDSNGVHYTARFHDPTGQAPAGSAPSWVVERRIPGTGVGTGPERHSRTEFYLGNGIWVPGSVWHQARQAYTAGTATPGQLNILRMGHHAVE